MFEIVYCECLKLKRSKIILPGILASLAVPLLAAVNDIRICFSNPEASLSLWGIYEDTMMFLMLLFGPLILASAAVYLVSREYTEKTLKTVFAVSIGRGRFLIGKFITLFILVMLFMALSWLDIVVISLICSLFFDVSQVTLLPAVSIFIQMIKGGVLLFPALTPFVYLALRTKGMLVPFIAIAVVSLCNVVLSGSQAAEIYPWTAAYLLLAGRNTQSGASVLPGIWLLLLLCVFGIGMSVWRFRKEDIV